MIYRFTPDGGTGRRIRELRLAAGLSQRGLTDGLERVSYAYVSRVEAGERTASLSALTAIAERLGTTALYLATGREHPCPVCGRE